MSMQVQTNEPETRLEPKPTTRSVRVAAAVAGLGIRALGVAPSGTLPGSTSWLLALAGATLLGLAGCPAWGPPAPPRFRQAPDPRPEVR